MTYLHWFKGMLTDSRALLQTITSSLCASDARRFWKVDGSFTSLYRRVPFVRQNTYVRPVRSGLRALVAAGRTLPVFKNRSYKRTNLRHFAITDVYWIHRNIQMIRRIRLYISKAT